MSLPTITTERLAEAAKTLLGYVTGVAPDFHCALLAVLDIAKYAVENGLSHVPHGVESAEVVALDDESFKAALTTLSEPHDTAPRAGFDWASLVLTLAPILLDLLKKWGGK
jgi:hypothetical protein